MMRAILALSYTYFAISSVFVDAVWWFLPSAIPPYSDFMLSLTFTMLGMVWVFAEWGLYHREDQLTPAESAKANQEVYKLLCSVDGVIPSKWASDNEIGGQLPPTPD